MADTPSKRTARVRNKPKKFGDYTESSTSKRRSYKDFESSDDEEMFEEGNQPAIKPTALFSNDDVGGQDMFQFKSRHTKLDLQNKVKLAISNSPKVSDTPKTPRKTGLSQAMLNSMSKVTEATPRHVKNIIKKRIIQEVERQSSDSESDFSGGSSSDFAPDKTDNESESSASQSEQEEEGSEEETPSKPAQKLQPSKPRGDKTKDSEYFVTPDNYFMMHSSKKITTSDHTLSRLKDLNLEEETQDIQISKEHEQRLRQVSGARRSQFDRWLYALSEDFNVLLYGIGSKRSILQQFQEEKLKQFPCVVVNGFFPSITVKSVMESIVVDLLGNSHVPSNVGDVVELIDGQLRQDGVHLFLIVHNIDGAMLRSAKAQAALASLSQINNVHTIATIDHINAPLLWDHTKLSKLRFTWWDVTTLAPYVGEAWSLGGGRVSRGAGLAALRAVHRALTHNAKGIYLIILTHQLDNNNTHNNTGLSFKELYSKSREQFLVSSELALRAQLTEFLDHKLVRTRRAADGSETLVIPIDNAVLRLFAEEQNT